MRYSNRTRPVPAEIRQLVATTLDNLGPTHAANRLGVSRSVVLTVAAGGDIMPGSLALLRDAFMRSALAPRVAN